MDWKKILTTDLGTLIRKGEPPHKTRARKSRAWPGPAYANLSRWRRDIIHISQQLGGIIGCNAPLVPGLDAAALDAPNRKIESVLMALRDDVTEGCSLSEAMSRRPSFFPKSYVDMVRIAEESGNLDETFAQLADEHERISAVMFPLKGWLAYGAAMGIAVMAILLFVIKTIIPEFSSIMGDFGSEAPSVVRFWMHVADLVPTTGTAIVMVGLPACIVFLMLLRMMARSIGHAYTIVVALAGVAAIFAIDILVIRSLLGRTEEHEVFLKWCMVLVAIVSWGILLSSIVPLWLSRANLTSRWPAAALLAIPFLRSLFIMHNLATAANMLARLTRSGIPLEEALDTSAKADLHPLYARKLARLADWVRRGESLTQAIEHEKAWMPPSFLSLVAVGEESGLLPDSLERLSRTYARETAKGIRILVDVTAPLGVVVIGCVVLSIHLTVFGILTTIIDAMAQAY